MPGHVEIESTIFVIFGAAGDLAWRKLVPSLCNLHFDKYLAERLAIIGMDQKAMSDEEFRTRMQEGFNRFSGRGLSAGQGWNGFGEHLSYFVKEFDDPSAYALIAEKIEEKSKE